jgi:DNA-binding protein H-NS
MPSNSLKSIEAQIRKLQARAQSLREKDRKPAIANIVRLMKAHEITVEEISSALSQKRGPGRPRASESGSSAGAAAGGRKRGVVPVKFRNPDTGATWTGRGRTPRWIVEAESAGTDRSAFAV